MVGLAVAAPMIVRCGILSYDLRKTPPKLFGPSAEEATRLVSSVRLRAPIMSDNAGDGKMRW